MTRNDLVAVAHQMAVEKQWWAGKPRSFGECAMLMISEIAEATECVRNGEPPLHLGRVDKVTVPDGALVESFGGKDFVMSSPDIMKCEGELVELADCAIRIADFAGFCKLDLHQLASNEKNKLIDSPWIDDLLNKTPLEHHVDVCFTLAQAAGLSRELDSLETSYNLLGRAFAKLELICQYRAGQGEASDFPVWDLWKAIRMKLAYNETRSMRHGGKVL